MRQLQDDSAGRQGVGFVPGGSGGPGSAVPVMLAERGADVAFSYRSNADAAATVSDEIRAAGKQAIFHQIDAFDPEMAQAVATDAESNGGVHNVIHAARPIIAQVHLSRIDLELLRSQMEAGICGFFNVVQPALEYPRESAGQLSQLRRRQPGGNPARDGLSPAGKGAVELFVWGPAAEEGRFGVRANGVGLAMTNAGMAKKLDESGDPTEKEHAAAIRNTPLPTFGTATDVAEARCFLASPRVAHISGQHLAVDGGYGS